MSAAAPASTDPTDRADPPKDRHAAILGELAGLGLELARDLQARALAAEGVEEATRLATAFHRISRGVRQTLALELKVERSQQQAQRDVAAARAEAARTPEPWDFAVAQRRNAVGRAVGRLIWSEAEAPDDDEGDDEGDDGGDDWGGDDGHWDVEAIAERERVQAEAEAEAERLQRRLNDWLAVAAQLPGFTTVDLDDLIVEACDAVGLDPGLLYEMPDRAPGPEPDLEAPELDAPALEDPEPANPEPAGADTG